MSLLRIGQKMKRICSAPTVFPLAVFLFCVLLIAPTLKDFQAMSKTGYLGSQISLRDQYMLDQTSSVERKASEEIVYSMEYGKNESIENLKRNSEKLPLDVPEQSLGISAGGSLIYMSQDELNAYFSNLQDLGVKWLRWDIDWIAVQSRNPNDYYWSASDRVVLTADRYGIRSLGIITYSPSWAHNGRCIKGNHCAPSSPASFARFAATVSERYEGIINHFEIWNEPNLAGSWSPRSDVEEYSSILKASYLAIKKVNPSAMVISGGLAVAADDTEGNMSPLTFVESLYAQGSQEYFDALALHPYTYPSLPDPDNSQNGWQLTLSIRKVMEENGDAEKKIWITEFGAPTDGSGSRQEINSLSFNYGADYIDEVAQDQTAKSILSLYEQNATWMGPFFWYNLQDLRLNKGTAEDFFGLIRRDGSKKPAYYTIKSIFNPE